MYLFLCIISAILLSATFLPLVHHDYWLFKILEYPRLQKFILVLALLIGWLFNWPADDTLGLVLFGGLCLSAAYLLYKILPYTFFTAKEMRDADGKTEDGIKIFSANVYQENKQYNNMLLQIRQTDPDIIFLLEVNDQWLSALRPLEKDYPYTLQQPLENTYGLAFFSRFPFESAKIVYLVKEDVPSIEVTLLLPSGRKVKIWGLHPEPPVPDENLYSTAKDKELMKVALKARDCTLPCIVMGDLNDVAWSHITTLFRKTSNLLDPRCGRGFYSTFSAHQWYMRFPLDYIFCSKEFGLVKMKRLPKNGSDHFAIFIQLAFLNGTTKQEEPEASKEELKEAREISQKSVPD